MTVWYWLDQHPILATCSILGGLGLGFFVLAIVDTHLANYWTSKRGVK